MNVSLRKNIEEIDRVYLFHYTHAVLMFLSFILFGSYTFSFFIMVITFLAFSKYFLRLARGLYYTFWSFALIQFLFLFFQTIDCFSSSRFGAGCLFGTSLIFLCLEAYMLSSPIYYPRVFWWEYDFRFNPNLKIDVDGSGMGRLTDVRRGAGCLIHFEEFTLGDTMRFSLGELENVFEVEVMSKRQYSLGRPYHYGVRFILDERDSGKSYRNLSDFWKKNKNKKLSAKLNQYSLPFNKEEI